MNSKVPLQGAELEEYLRNERAAKEKAAAEEAALARTQPMLEADEGESESEDSEDEEAVEHALDDDVIDTAEPGNDGLPAYTEPGANHGRRKGKKDNDLVDWGFETEDGSVKQMLSYDIYLKGNVSKANTFFKADRVQQQKFRMFPYIERRRRIDSYGEVLDVGTWLRKGKILEEEAESDMTKDTKKQKEEEENTKVSHCALHLVLRC